MSDNWIQPFADRINDVLAANVANARPRTPLLFTEDEGGHAVSAQRWRFDLSEYLVWATLAIGFLCAVTLPLRSLESLKRWRETDDPKRIREGVEALLAELARGRDGDAGEAARSLVASSRDTRIRDAIRDGIRDALVEHRWGRRAGEDAERVTVVVMELLRRAGGSDVPPTRALAALEAPIKILFLAANPNNAPRLDLAEEQRTIQTALSVAIDRGRIELTAAGSVDSSDLQALVRSLCPEIVHFSGHGTSEGLILQKGGRAELVRAEALAHLFQSFKNSVRVVVLSACYSEALADAVAAHGPVVVGMEATVPDRAATLFAAQFYGSLAVGHSIASAVEQGEIGVELGGAEGHFKPCIKTSPGVDASSLVLVPASPTTAAPWARRSTRLLPPR